MKALHLHFLCVCIIVGMTRFELATSGPPDRCATGLRHIPCEKKSTPYFSLLFKKATAKVLLFFGSHK